MRVDHSQMYRVKAVAELLDVSVSTVYRAVESGALASPRIGTSVRVTGQALDAWTASCAQVTEPTTDGAR